MAVRLEASAASVHWGYLDAALPPAVTIDSGETVTISTVSGPPEALPPQPHFVPPALYDIHKAKTKRMLPGHMCTGPVAVRGARSGQVLQVDIGRDRDTARATLGHGLAVSAFPRYVPV
jgi:acetamidase/formamidase